MTELPRQIQWPAIDAAFLEQLLLTLSHRLRTPLTVALGEATTLRRAYRRLKPTERDAMLDAIVAACQRLERTLQHLQLTAQVLQQQVALQFELVDMGLLTAQSLQILAEVHGSKALQAVTVNAPQAGQAVIATADARLMAAVLVHLIDNALLYSPSDRPVAISFHHEPDVVLWEIRDQGTGISPDRFAHLTEPFSQMHQSLTSPMTGLGLGLTFCQAVLLSHDSQLQIASEVGQGTHCWFTLPNATAHLAELATGTE